jgi:hypothetical protein
MQSFIPGQRAKLGVSAIAILLFSVTGLAQQVQTPSPPTGLPSALPSAPLPAASQTAASTEDDRTNTRSSGTGLSINPSSNGTLTANQIIGIVQARPELIVDIKQVMADYLEQQGSPVQVDSITDDALYRGIASDAGLRGAISVWLRARGYVSESEFDRSDMDPRSSDDVSNNMNASASRFQCQSSRSRFRLCTNEVSRVRNPSSNPAGVQGNRNVPRQPAGRDASSATKPIGIT